MERDEPVSTRVIEKIAEQRGMDPIEMRPRLSDVIDPDGLDQFFSETGRGRREANARVEFTYDEYVVTIEDSGGIDVRERATSVGTDEEVTASSKVS